jgi:hypothetical protein
VSIEAARAVADAALSVRKNLGRWQFGVVMPGLYAALDTSESAFCQTECVLEYTEDTVVEVLIRFLQLQRRSVQVRRDDGYAPVDELVVGDVRLTPWEEAVERELTIRVPVTAALAGGRQEVLHVDGGTETEVVHDPGSGEVGRVVRKRHRVDGVITVTGGALPGPWQALKLRVHVENTTEVNPWPRRREDALPGAMVAVHVIADAQPGAFVSMVDPPEWAREAVATCTNVGCWPVFAGPPAARNVILAAPIVPNWPGPTPPGTGRPS